MDYLKTAGIVAVVALVVGFLAGRASVVTDDQELRDSLAVYREHRRQDAEALDSSRNVILAARAMADMAEQESVKWRNIAAARQVVANRFRDSADAAGRRLAEATTPEDSLRACIPELLARRSECAALRETNTALVVAAQQDDSVKQALRRETAAHLGQRGRDSTRLREADGLINRLEKAAGGCRIPLVGLPCPLAVAGYNVTLSRFEGGVGLPVKVGPIRGVAMVTWSP
jgi:hypothetical protein